MRRRSEDGVDALASLPLLFEDPLSEVEPIVPRSNTAASREIETLQKKLQPETAWDDKCEAIKRCMSLIKGNALAFPDFDLMRVAPDIAKAVCDLRSSLVKWGALFVAAASKELGTKFSQYIDIFIPALFKQTTHGTAIISQSCRLGIVQIVVNCPHRRTAKVILSKLSSKSSVHRFIVAESVKIMLAKWPQSTVSPLQQELNSAMTSLKKDAAADVRATANSVSQTRSPSPRRAQTMTPSKFGSLKLDNNSVNRPIPFMSKTVRIDSNKPSKFEIAIPTTPADASLFIKQIQQILETGTAQKRKKVGSDIAESLPAALELIPDNTAWPIIIPQLFTHFTADMKTVASNVIAATQFNEVIIGSAIKTYGLETLVHNFEHDADIVQFIVVIKTKFTQIPIPESVLPELSRLPHTSQKAPGIEVINSLLNENSKSVQQIFHEIVRKIKKNLVFDDQIELLLNNESENFNDEMEQSVSCLADLLESANEDVVKNTLKLLDTILQNWPYLSLDYLIPPLINLTLDESTTFPPKAERILMQMLPNSDIETTILPLLKGSSSDQVIGIVQHFLETVSDKVLIEYQSFLPDAILPLFESKNVSARRSAVMSYVVFSNILGHEFDYQLKKLSQMNQMLVHRFAKKKSLMDVC